MPWHRELDDCCSAGVGMRSNELCKIQSHVERIEDNLMRCPSLLLREGVQPVTWCSPPAVPSTESLVSGCRPVQRLPPCMASAWVVRRSLGLAICTARTWVSSTRAFTIIDRDCGADQSAPCYELPPPDGLWHSLARIRTKPCSLPGSLRCATQVMLSILSDASQP